MTSTAKREPWPTLQIADINNHQRALLTSGLTSAPPIAARLACSCLAISSASRAFRSACGRTGAVPGFWFCDHRAGRCSLNLPLFSTIVDKVVIFEAFQAPTWCFFGADDELQALLCMRHGLSQRCLNRHTSAYACLLLSLLAPFQSLCRQITVLKQAGETSSMSGRYNILSRTWFGFLLRR